RGTTGASTPAPSSPPGGPSSSESIPRSPTPTTAPEARSTITIPTGTGSAWACRGPFDALRRLPVAPPGRGRAPDRRGGGAGDDLGGRGREPRPWPPQPARCSPPPPRDRRDPHR